LSLIKVEDKPKVVVRTAGVVVGAGAGVGGVVVVRGVGGRGGEF